MTVAQVPQSVIPKPSLRKKIEELSGQKISACFQCQKCTNGCPVTFAMDIMPHKAMRLLHLGLVDEVLHSDTIWVCASCETCTTRCPNDIDIARVMDTLRQLSQREGVKSSQKNFPIFHSAFLSSIRRHGRVHETEMAVNYALKSGGIAGLLKQAGTGLAMFTRGKIKLLPPRLRGKSQVRDIFKKTKVKE
ncbi:MAG TPA: 4Fe-4S dicluster domain-containing protein [Dehalococcoidales bacterium]|nr:4Fe-4S dicluster domain-containing protein [Dehalococcoidales bacterium]